MKELSEERAKQIHDRHWSSGATHTDIAMLQEAYRLGQQEAGVGEQRFQAACAAFNGLLVSPHFENYTVLVNDALYIADALIAELKRTASDAGKGGEHE